MRGQNNDYPRMFRTGSIRDLLRYVKPVGSVPAAAADSDTYCNRLAYLDGKEINEQSVVKDRYRNLIDVYGH